MPEADFQRIGMLVQNAVLLMVLWFMGFAYSVPALTYYTATYGDDSNPGSSALPWRSIQKAANTLLPGDTVMVLPGEYDERVTTSRGGTGENGRIVFEATGSVVTRGFVINHSYITARGFEITGHWVFGKFSG